MARPKYIWELKGWPQFVWDASQLLKALGDARKAQGKLMGMAAEVGIEAQAQVLAEDAIQTSAIEGEKLDPRSVRSSVAKRLGLPMAGLPSQQQHIEGLVEMLLDATLNFSAPLTGKRLRGWQAGLFPTGHSGIHSISVGKWRGGSEPMLVVSGMFGKERVHFKAPPSKNIEAEMNKFLGWFNTSSSGVDGLVRAAVAHFWFVTIHPFDDGNGRIARAITDMALAQDEKSSVRIYSMSSIIKNERESYYQILETCQKGSLDLTLWIVWFLKIFVQALEQSEILIYKSAFISKFWKKNIHLDLNPRQKKVLQKLLEAEPEGFIGGMTNKKYVSITKTSRETAKRDLVDLEEKGLVKRSRGGGRSVSYGLVKLSETEHP